MPFLQRIRHLWEEWMMVMLNKEGEICEATRREVAEWMAIVYWQMVDLKF